MQAFQVRPQGGQRSEHDVGRLSNDVSAEMSEQRDCKWVRVIREMQNGPKKKSASRSDIALSALNPHGSDSAMYSRPVPARPDQSQARSATCTLLSERET